MVEQEIAKLDGHEIIDGKLKLALNMIFVVQFIPSVPFHIHVLFVSLCFISYLWLVTSLKHGTQRENQGKL